MPKEKAKVVVIGGGGTGGALAYDLARRGFEVALFERGELTSGTTGRHHGQLHCGARYAVRDRNIGRECMKESEILRRIAPEAVEFNGGLFLAMDDEGIEYLGPFLEGCAEAGIPAERLDPAEALRREPGVNPDHRAAVLVPDGSIDAFRLALSFFAGAKSLGAGIRPYHLVTGIDVTKGRVRGVRVRDLVTGRDRFEKADAVVNSGGAWAGRIAALAGVNLPVTPSPGTLLAVKGRLVDLVVSRLAPPGDGDILVPQRRLSIIGTTQWTTEDLEDSRFREEDLSFLVRRAAELVPAFSTAKFHAAWAAPRPLFGRPDAASGRELSRDFACVHHDGEGAAGFFSVLGGKATVLRAMAEKAADAVCRYFSVDAPCRTAEAVLPSWRAYYRGGTR